MAHYKSDAEGKLHKYAGNSHKAYMPLGMIFASSVELDELNVKRLDGQSLTINGSYHQFCSWVISRGNKVPTCDIATYASEMTTYGQCGRYVINNTSTAQTSGNYTVPAYSIKLPTITEFVASNNGGDAMGLAEADLMYALPQGGEETRPKNIRYPYYVVVAQGVRLQALVDVEKKAETDASNLSEGNIESWREKLKVADIIWSGHFRVANNAQLVLDIPEDAKLLVIGNCEDSTARNGIVLSVNNPAGEIYTWNVQNQGNTFLKSCSYTKSGNTITFSNCRERINFGSSNTYDSLTWHIEWVGVIR